MSPDEAQAMLASLLAKTPAAPPAVDAAESVVLYGAGDLGKLGAAFLSHVGVPVAAALDRKAKPGDKLQEAIPVFSPDAFAPQDQPILVAINNLPYKPIEADLNAKGWKRVFPFYDYAAAFAHRHPLYNGWFAGELSPEDKRNVEATLAGWSDDWSRAAYLQFLAWRIAREEWPMDDAPANPADRFFIPEIEAARRGDEIFVDAGAYDGRVLKKFLEHAPRCPEAHLFEAEPENIRLLERMIETLPQGTRIHVHRHALSNRSGKAAWSGGFGMASRLGDPGGHTVDAIRLDDLALAPGFIKLHLEGGEYAALEGGMETVKRHRPLLTATVYHNRDGLWRTAQLLMQNLEDYRFYFRAHSWCGTGAVVYGVPYER